MLLRSSLVIASVVAIGAGTTLAIAPPDEGVTDLMRATERGDLAGVERLIAAGADVDARDTSGDTALIRAVEEGHVKIVGELLDAKADPMLGGQADALQVALRRGEEALVQMLSIAVDARIHRDLAQMRLATAVYRDDPRAVITAIDGGADPDDRDDVARPLVHVAARLGHVAALQALLDAGAWADAMDMIGFTALMVAARHGQAEAIDPLLAAGASVDHQAEPRGLSLRPLHLAAIGGDPVIVREIAAAGAEIDAVDRNGRTALHWAVGEGQAEAALALLELGADPSVAAHHGTTVGDLAREHDLTPVLEALGD